MTTLQEETPSKIRHKVSEKNILQTSKTSAFPKVPTLTGEKCHWTHHHWQKALSGDVLFRLLQGFCTIYRPSSKAALELVPCTQMAAPRVPAGEEGRAPSASAREQLAVYINPTTAPHGIFSSNKQKHCRITVPPGRPSDKLRPIYNHISHTKICLGCNAWSFCLCGMKCSVCTQVFSKGT